MKITRLEQQKNSPTRVSLYIDDEFFAGMNVDIILKYDLFEGKEMNNKLLGEILEQEEYQKCLNKVYDYLSRRAQSEKEIKTKLRGKFSKMIIDKAINHLKDLGYIDDRKFAEVWIEQRKNIRGRYALNQELIKKGIDKALISDLLDKKVADPEAEFETARNLALRKFNKEMTKEETYNKVGGFLTRRGFGYEIVKRVINEFINS